MAPFSLVASIHGQICSAETFVVLMTGCTTFFSLERSQCWLRRVHHERLITFHKQKYIEGILVPCIRKVETTQKICCYQLKKIVFFFIE